MGTINYCDGGGQTIGHAFGQGQGGRDGAGNNWAWEGNGGAGGGWYGGYSLQSNATKSAANGGGGSGYIGGVENGSMQNGIRTGNGQAKISW